MDHNHPTLQTEEWEDIDLEAILKLEETHKLEEDLESTKSIHKLIKLAKISLLKDLAKEIDFYIIIFKNYYKN